MTRTPRTPRPVGRSTTRSRRWRPIAQAAQKLKPLAPLCSVETVECEWQLPSAPSSSCRLPSSETGWSNPPPRRSQMQDWDSIHLEGMGWLGSLIAHELTLREIPFTWNELLPADGWIPTAWQASSGLIYPS